MPSEDAKRVAVTDRTIWEGLATRLHPKAHRIRSTNGEMYYYTTEGVEGEQAVWSVEHQMGYVVL